MDRRRFLAAATGGTLAMTFPAGAADAKSGIIELTYMRMRNTTDAMAQRTNDYVAKVHIPALQRAGAKHVGAFTSVIGASNPSTILISDYADEAAWGAANRRIGEDKEAQKAYDAVYGVSALPYLRMETVIFRSFASVPGIEPPSARQGNQPHVFELRTYESNSPRSLARKIRMFEEGEIALFRKIGMKVVFFGEALTGPNLPQLTYLVAFDDAAHREKAWSNFGSHPEWTRLKNMPGVSDGEIVSNISNSLLRPMPFSGIK